MHGGWILASVELRVTVDGGLLLGYLRASYKYATLLRVLVPRRDSGAQVLEGVIFYNWCRISCRSSSSAVVAYVITDFESRIDGSQKNPETLLNR